MNVMVKVLLCEEKKERNLHQGSSKFPSFVSSRLCAKTSPHKQTHKSFTSRLAVKSSKLLLKQKLLLACGSCALLWLLFACFEGEDGAVWEFFSAKQKQMNLK